MIVNLEILLFSYLTATHFVLHELLYSNLYGTRMYMSYFFHFTLLAQCNHLSWNANYMQSPLFFSPPALFSYFSGQNKSTIVIVNPTNSTTHIRVTRTRCSIGMTTRCSIKDTQLFTLKK
jgi:hypothetical protein